MQLEKRFKKKTIAAVPSCISAQFDIFHENGCGLFSSCKNSSFTSINQSYPTAQHNQSMFGLINRFLDWFRSYVTFI